MIRNTFARFAALATIALTLGTQAVSKADKVCAYGLFGNNGTPSLYAELEVRNVAGKTDPNSWFYVTDGDGFCAMASADTVQITKDKDGTVRTDMQGNGFYNDYDTPVIIEEHLTRSPNGAASLSVRITSADTGQEMYMSSAPVVKPQVSKAAAPEIPLVDGSTWFFAGK